MPVFSRSWPDKSGKVDPNRLRESGPLLQVEISVPNPLAGYLSKQGYDIPAPIPGWALIDTGASITGVEVAVLSDLNLPPVDITTVQTPSGEERQVIFPCCISFPGTPIPPLDLNRVTGCKLKRQGLTAIIGRDVLKNFQLVYNGIDGFWTLAF